MYFQTATKHQPFWAKQSDRSLFSIYAVYCTLAVLGQLTHRTHADQGCKSLFFLSLETLVKHPSSLWQWLPPSHLIYRYRHFQTKNIPQLLHVGPSHRGSITSAPSLKPPPSQRDMTLFSAWPLPKIYIHDKQKESHYLINVSPELTMALLCQCASVIEFKGHLWWTSIQLIT